MDKLFTCSNCQQQKALKELSRQFANFSFCRFCSLQAQKQAETKKPTPETSPCAICYELTKQPKLVHVNNFSHLNPKLISQVCLTCFQERIIPNPLINYCPYFGEGYQGWDTNQPKYDCQCQIKQYE